MRVESDATCNWRTSPCLRVHCRWWWRNGHSWREGGWSLRCFHYTTASTWNPRTRTPSGTCAVHLLPQKIENKYSVHLHVISIFYNFFLKNIQKISNWKNYFGSKYQAEKFKKMSIIRVKSRHNFPDFFWIFRFNFNSFKNSFQLEKM